MYEDVACYLASSHRSIPWRSLGSLASRRNFSPRSSLVSFDTNGLINALNRGLKWRDLALRRILRGFWYREHSKSRGGGTAVLVVTIQRTKQSQHRLQQPSSFIPINKTIMTQANAYNPTTNDVLLGRGGATNNHAGNKRFRSVVSAHQVR